MHGHRNGGILEWWRITKYFIGISTAQYITGYVHTKVWHFYRDPMQEV